MPTKKRPKDEAVPAQLRLERKIAVFGDDAPLVIDEISAYWNVSPSSAEKIVASLPLADPLPKVRRWRFGDVKRQFLDMVQERAS
jgi:hypothetical protein